MRIPREQCRQCGQIEPIRPEQQGLCYVCLRKTPIWKTLTLQQWDKIRGRHYHHKHIEKKRPEPPRLVPQQIQNLSVGQILRAAKEGRLTVG